MQQLRCDEQNDIARLTRFLSQWDAGPGRDLDIAPDEHAPQSSFGNINVGARPWSAPSLLVPRNHEHFYRYVEPGVRAWVSWFVSRGYTTYTSCEGHDYGLGQESDFRHVGVLLRRQGQRRDLLEAFEAVRLPTDSICDIAFLDHFVLSEGERHGAIDFFLIPRNKNSVHSYFANIDVEMQSMLSQMED